MSPVGILRCPLHSCVQTAKGQSANDSTKDGFAARDNHGFMVKALEVLDLSAVDGRILGWMHELLPNK
jgi:hypothetical protein